VVFPDVAKPIFLYAEALLFCGMLKTQRMYSSGQDREEIQVSARLQVWTEGRRQLFMRAAAMICAAGVLTCTLLGCEALGLGYVGTDTCLSCHNGTSAMDRTEFRDSKHFDKGCESCHGPGALHVRNGGRWGLFVITMSYPMEACVKCHQTEVNGFKDSAHYTEGVMSCTECHEVHSGRKTPRTYNDNQLCLQCHAYSGFATEADVSTHTFHDVDPSGTGQSRCVLCHMTPLQRTNQDAGKHGHSMNPLPPISSNQAGVTPAPPNSCAGITGCHDGSIDTAPVFDVDNPSDNERLQILYSTRYGS